MNPAARRTRMWPGFAGHTGMAGERISFKEMCERFEVTPRTLRYYEYIELLDPDREGRNRLYSAREVARMTLILRGRRWGFALEEIRQWLQIYEDQGSRRQKEVLLEASERQLTALTAERDQLTAAIDELRNTRDLVARELEQAPDEG